MTIEGRTSFAVVFEGVHKQFWRDRKAITAIDDLSFALRRGEYTCILGRSGCGKSTAANLLLGLDRPTSGQIRVFGVDPVTEFARLRGRIGTVFQSDRLLPWRTAIDNVRLPLEILRLDESDLAVSATQWLTQLGLQGFEPAYPHQLSGGMRQRVALARALVANPEIVVADEAFAHLDEVTGERLRRDFHRLVKESGKTVVHITHSIDEALGLGDRILVVGKPGHLVTDLKDIAGHDRAVLRALILGYLQEPERLLRQADQVEPAAPDERVIASNQWAT
jgi:NitT/TauT family transport system ATP-binding protein